VPKKELQPVDRVDPAEAADRGRRCDLGATIMEYALIVSAIALVAVIGVGVFGDAVSDLFQDIADAF